MFENQTHKYRSTLLTFFMPGCVSIFFSFFFNQRDDRGTIDRLRVGGKRINLLYSKQATMRSGYLHPETKYDFVISGEVEVWILTPQGTDKKIYKPCESFRIPPYTPHVLHFLSDSVLAEWWYQKGESRCWFYHPYRRIVDVQNSLVSMSTGQHQLLVPQNEYDQQQLLPKSSLFPSIGGLLCLGTGLALGFLAGSCFPGSSGRK